MAALVVAAAAASAAPQVLIDTDFGAAGKPFSDIKPASGNSITGTLPEGWGENSGWKTNLVATYQPVSEAGRRFVRVSVTSGDGVQFRHDLPGIEKEASYYRLTLTARSVIGASLGLRFNDAPYATVWSANPALDDQWRDFTYDFRLQPQKQGLGLYVYLPGVGTLDLQKLKLIKLSEQDLIEEIKAKHPDAGQGNLVRLSRFPLGLQSGWAIDRDYSDGDQVQVESDPKVPGPSGVPALRLSAPDGIRVYSAPFPTPWSFDQHVLSLCVRGDWDGKLLIGGGMNEIRAQLPLKLSGDQWQRVELPFRPLLLAPAHHLRIEGKGTLWIDQMQVERAAKATDFSPQKAVEVSLALPASEASSARVLFEGEPLKVNYAVVGLSGAAVLKARLVSLYGDEKPLPVVKLGGAQRVASGTLRFEAFKVHPLGAYRLEAWVEDTSGKKLSAENEVVFYRLHRPRYWGKDAPTSFFGTHTLSTNRHLTMAKVAGCNWVRLHDAGTQYIGWAHLEPEKGKWEFRDADLKRYRDHNLKILGLLSTAPGWATNWGKPITGYFERYMEPLNMDDWANAVRTIVSHHKGLIDSYEIWNEPWGSAFWSWKFDQSKGSDYTGHFVPSETPSADYARLQKVAYAAAHEVFPKVTIVGFNTYGAENGTKWTKDLLGFGALDTCDAISYHRYEDPMTGFPGDASEIACKAAVGPIVEKLGRVPKPVWMSEGCPLSGDVSNGFYRYTLPYENTNDNWRIADRLMRYVVSHRANGEAKEFLYTMHGTSTFGGHVTWTTLVTAEGYLHPSAAAHSALAWLIEDTDYVKRIPLAEGVYAYLFRGKDRSVAVISTAAKHAAYKLPKSSDVQLLDLFGNPLPPGSALGEHVSYVVCKDGLSKLQSVLEK